MGTLGEAIHRITGALFIRGNSAPRTMVYIDGFNLYYGCIKGTPYRWLDLRTLCMKLLPNHEIVGVKYFTAMVDCPSGSVRQRVYLDAIEAQDDLEVYYGHFLSHPANRPLAGQGKKSARVILTEEKGSDVNLASHLLMDAFLKRYDVAVVISNDSDLATPIEMVRTEFGKKVGLLNPHKKPAKKLLSCTDFYKQIRQGVLAASQLPTTVVVDGRQVTKPSSW